MRIRYKIETCHCPSSTVTHHKGAFERVFETQLITERQALGSGRNRT